MSEVDTGAPAAPDAAAAAAAAAAALGTPAAPATPPWHQGFEPEVIGHLQNRGWADKTPAEAAREAVKAFREAEKLIGVPSDQVLRLPKPADGPDAWKAVYERLGAPADAKDYDFSTVKNADGSAPPEAFVDFARTQAAQYHIPKDQAASFAADLLKFQSAADASKASEASANLANAKTALAQSWGPNLEANLWVAKQTALKLGVTEEQVSAFEQVAGYDKVMEFFRSVGQKIGEDKFITSGNPNAPGVMTREQAVARKSELMADSAWVKRYQDGGVKSSEFREFQALATIIASGQQE